MSDTPDKIFHIDEVSDDAVNIQNNTADSSSQIQSLSDYLRLNSNQLN